MVDIELRQAGWATQGGTQVRGGGHLDGRCLDAAAVADMLDRCDSEDEWKARVGALNGSFAAVSRRGGVVLAAVDRVRSIPLFYGSVAARGRLADSAHAVRELAPQWDVDPVADAEFQLTGYVTGPDTLLRGIHQLQAGEMLRWDSHAAAGPQRGAYYRSVHGNYVADDPAALIPQLEQVHHNVFRRLLEGIGSTTIVVPLSGGYDSRLIGVSLRDLGARNVICYSYGVPGNWEASISQELARYLGFRWEFVPYSGPKWRAWAAAEGFRAYCDMSGNLASVPHLQDWAAVAELQRSGTIPRDSVFVPGHSGDFIAGSHIPKHFVSRASITRRELLDAILRLHYSLWERPVADRAAHEAAFVERIEAIVGGIPPECSPEVAADLFERWDLQERQAKFIINSVRVYEHFGYDWRIPLFDHELMDFWARIPVELRVGRSLYFEFVRERQQLPVTSANTDRNAVLDAVVRAVDAAGLRTAALKARRLYRTLLWRREYESSMLGWNALVDRDFFGRTYSGNQILHAYMTLGYRDHVMSSLGRIAGRNVVPGLSPSV